MWSVVPSSFQSLLQRLTLSPAHKILSRRKICARRPHLWGLLALIAWGLPPMVHGQTVPPPVPSDYFVIEAEDFNFASGQTLPVASTMPYYGGAYAGLNTAVLNVDYARTADASSATYRNDNRIPITPNADFDRTGWTMTENYRLGWIAGGEWFNYTRVIPPAKYRVYAGISYGGTGDALCRGDLYKLTSGATNVTQTTVKLGTFSAPGTGTWGLNAVVPMTDTAGRTSIIDLGGTNTIRFVALSGDYDYLKFVKAKPPVVGQQPVDVTVTESRPATFTLTLGSDDPAAFQWQTNQVSVPGATNISFSFVPTLGADGLHVRCILTNILGATTSATAILHVTPDTVRPRLLSAMNIGAGAVRLQFDEPVLPPSGAASSSFTLTGGVLAQGVTQGPGVDQLDVSTTPLTFGTSYSISASGVTDRAATPNPVLPGSSVGFIALEFASQPIGQPAAAGSISRVTGGFDLTGGGLDIGGSADEFQFAWQVQKGDFDIQARIPAVTITDPFMHAGLMARESLSPNSRFVGAFAGSLQLGCFFESRSTTGGVAVITTPTGGVPVNYPLTWVRLKRAGISFTGFASLDSTNWIQLGSLSLTSLTNPVYFGMAVSSQNAQSAAAVSFRDVTPTVSTALGGTLPTREALGPSSRRTGLVFSEIMYHPKIPAGSTTNLEFIEIYNADSIFEELTGFEIRGGVHYAFPPGYTIPAGGFAVVAADPAAIQQAYGITGVLGPWTGSLNNAGDTIRLHDAFGAVKLEVTYASDPPWPAAADGAGPSLVLARPSFGENQPEAWAASGRIGGTPGQMEPFELLPQRNVVINEFLAHTDDPQVDYVELYNRSNLPVDISGCYLSDDPATNRFQIPAGTSIPARGFIAFDQNALGFRLNAVGETLYLLDPPATHVLDTVRFSDQENGVSSGRYPDGAPTFRRLANPTPGAANGPFRQEPLVINEVLYNPISQDSDDEFVELYNRSAGAVDLTGWTLDSGIHYTFPAGTTLLPGGYLVVARNAQHLIPRYPQLNAANTLGDYSGTLGNGGDRLVLTKPDTIASTNSLGVVKTNTIHIVVSEVLYKGGGRWGQWASGGGSSLELIDPHADLLRPSNWADSDETQKAPWTTVTVTDVLDNGNGSYPPDRLQISLQGAGECLIDNVEVFKAGTTNLVANGDFESTAAGVAWTVQGNHSLSTIDLTGAFAGTRCLHLRSQGDGDTGVNSVRRPLAAGLAAGERSPSARRRAGRRRHRHHPGPGPLARRVA